MPRTSLLVMTLLATAVAPVAADGGRLRFADEVAYALDSPETSSFVGSAVPRVVWRREIVLPGATSIAPHFVRFELAPGDELVARDPENRRVWRYRSDAVEEDGLSAGDSSTGSSRGKTREGGFWGVHIPGERLLLELVSRGGSGGRKNGGGGFTLDALARGFDPATSLFAPEEICGADDKLHAQCYATSDPAIYGGSRAVARLAIQGQFLCTGWLVGSAGHLMTNNHCFSTEAEVDDTVYEFLAERSCATNCPTLACPGTIVATSATLIRTNATIDYTLVQLPVDPTPTYGYLQMRSADAVVGERISIPQHPAGRGKEIAVVSSDAHDGSGFAEIDSVSSSSGIYFGDTESGSSGSPVIAFADRCVVVLHRGTMLCANGGNLGALSSRIVADLGGLLPPDGGRASGLCIAGPLFADGFESHNTSAWSATVP
ncbi:MAG: serine protease [Thermoanaerobaculia bacterium]